MVQPVKELAAKPKVRVQNPKPIGWMETIDPYKLAPAHSVLQKLLFSRIPVVPLSLLVIPFSLKYMPVISSIFF